MIDVTEYSSRTSCLIDILKHILNTDENFNQLNIKIFDLKLKHIYLGFVFLYKEKEFENEILIKKIFELLEKNEKMTKKVDVIGDKFYYLFEGNKKLKNMKQYDIVTAGTQTSLQLIYETNQKDNSMDDFEIGSYKEFIDIIRKNLTENMPYIRIKPIINSSL